MTNYELVEFAKSKIGTSYVYGMKGAILTLEKYKELKAKYGNNIWNSDIKKVGKICCDCSGLISWATGIIRSSTNYKEIADKIYPISTIKNAPIGALVWKQGHIGIYIGTENGIPYYIAEDGSAYNCRKNKISNASFTHWFLCKDIEYIKTEEKDEYMVTQAKIKVNGKEYVVNRILYNDKNYIELRSLEQAGFKVDYINSTPILDSPKE